MTRADACSRCGCSPVRFVWVMQWSAHAPEAWRMDVLYMVALVDGKGWCRPDVKEAEEYAAHVAAAKLAY